MSSNRSYLDKIKSGSRKAFIGLGNIAIGNYINENEISNKKDIMPFSLTMIWLYEKPMPKRKRK